MLRVSSIATAKGRSVAARRVLELAPAPEGEAAATITVRAPLPVDLEQAKARHAADLQALLDGSHVLYEAGLLDGVPLDVRNLAGVSSMIWAAHLCAQCALEHTPIEVDGTALALELADPSGFARGLYKLLAVHSGAASAVCSWALEPQGLEVSEGNGLPPASSPAGEPVQADPSTQSHPSTGMPA
jgi:hypothetical protein